MHLDSFNEMERALNIYLFEDRKYRVVDIGSQLIVGLGLQKTYRDLMKPKWDYTGIDVVSGVNVDLLMKNGSIPIENSCIDVVLSGQCLEHCENPFSLVKEMARIMVPDGLIVIAAPFNQGRHLEFDRWRFLPQGFKTLFDYAGLRCIDVYLNQTYKTKGPGKGEKRFLDCWGVGKK